MKKTIDDYFARCMKDPAYATAYHDLEAEFQAERARIQSRIQRDSHEQKLKGVSEYFDSHPNLIIALDLLQQLEKQLVLLTNISLTRQLIGSGGDFQISSEASYERNIISTEVNYNADIL